MPLSWNEIRSRALAFSREWADATSENAQAKPFWIEFFDVFGITSKRVASFEEPVHIVYNNFPWPDCALSPGPSPASGRGEKMWAAIEAAAQAVLDARARFPSATLADLYDPLTMPPELLKAHQALDRAVDAAYGRKSFTGEAERVAFLFERYQTLTSLLSADKPVKRRAKTTQATQ
jgi:hypothetical protein